MYFPISSSTRSSIRNILTRITFFSARDIDTLPSPILAASIAAEDIDRSSVVRHGARHAIDGEIGDRDPVRRFACRAPVLVVLFDDDSIIGDVGQLDVGVRDLRDGAGGTVDGFNANAILGVGDAGVLDSYVLDGVIVAAAYRADGETVAAGTSAVGEEDVLNKIISASAPIPI